ncbi:hypothetical protein Tco_0548542 [Tanacetum coccineum]
MKVKGPTITTQQMNLKGSFYKYRSTYHESTESRRLQLRHRYKFPDNERSGPDEYPSGDGDIPVEDEHEVDISKLTRKKSLFELRLKMGWLTSCAAYRLYMKLGMEHEEAISKVKTLSDVEDL